MTSALPDPPHHANPRVPFDVPPAPQPALWWQHGVIYQVYPRSFQDSDGDGVGDLRGIAARLEHLEWLGVDAVWISPVYPSPMADFGYDVSDYRGIDPMFGTLDDWDHLVAEAHARDIRIIMDFIPNHTSDQHPWFQASRASRRENPRRDWYLWKRPRAPDGGPPNNWLSNFGGSAWTLGRGDRANTSTTPIFPQQPDLNWRKPAVQREMLGHSCASGWNAVWMASASMRCGSSSKMITGATTRQNPDYQARSRGPTSRLLPLYTTDRPEVLDMVERMRRCGGRATPSSVVLIGELYLPIPRLMAYYGATDGAGLHLPTNFHHAARCRGTPPRSRR